MRKIIKIIFVSLFCLHIGASFSFSQEKAKAKNIFPPYILAEGKEFSFSIPLDWKAYVFPGQAGVYFRRIVIAPPGEKSFKLYLEIYPNNYLSPFASFSKRKNRVSGEAEIKKYLHFKFLEIKEYVGRKKPKIKSFNGDGCKGFYFSEKIQKNNDIVKSKYFTQGAFLLEGYIVVFNIKGNYGKSTTFSQIFKLLKSCKIGQSVVTAAENEEEEKIATLLAFLGKEYKKVNNFKADASVQIIQDKKVLKGKQRLSLSVDTQKECIRADNRKEKVAVISYVEDIYGYYNFFAKGVGANNVAAIINSFMDFEWFFFFWPWRNDVSFLKEHDFEVRKSKNAIKGQQVLRAKTKPFVFKFYDELELQVDVLNHRVEKLVYSIYGTKLKCAVFFDYSDKIKLAIPVRVRVRVFDDGSVVDGRNVFLKKIKANTTMSESVFALEGKIKKKS